MKFDKTKEHTIRFENFSGYLLIREFQFDDEQTSNALAEFMKTRYFSWQEEFRNKVNVTINNSVQQPDWNFHGLYDIKKLRPEHFIPVSSSDFVGRFKEVLHSEIGTGGNLREAQDLLNRLIDLNSEFYLLGNLSDELRHEWTVFDYFFSGFKISYLQKTLTAVECGLD